MPKDKKVVKEKDKNVVKEKTPFFRIRQFVEKKKTGVDNTPKVTASEMLTPDKKVAPPPLFGVKTDSVTQQLLRTDKSTDNPNVELARIMSVWDMVMNEFGWEDCKFSSIIRDAQASVDGKYHNDIKEVAIAQEIQARDERKGGKPSTIGLKVLQ